MPRLPKVSACHSTMDMAILLNESISDNIGLTAEGYLICQNVPVARTGIQYYLGSELGMTGQYANQRIKVYRLPEDVFDEETLKSLESKPITDDHPREEVNVNNAAIYKKGHGRNVRHDDKYIYTELLVDEGSLISKIRSKKKYQISLGYRCRYEPYKDGFKQTDIRINHIAVVEAGRAGDKVSIQDELNPLNKIGAKKPMNKTEAQSRMFAAFAATATPEEITEVLPFITNDAATTQTSTEKQTQSADIGMLAKLFGAMMPTKARDEDEPGKKDKEKEAEEKEAADKALAEKIDKLIGDALEKRLGTKAKSAKDEAEEELNKMLAEDDDDDDAGKKETDDDDEDDKEAKDSKALMDALKVINPLLASMPDKQRKAVKDHLRKSIKPGKTKDKSALAAIQQAVAKAAKGAARDSAPKDDSRRGLEIARKHNPHYKQA